MKRFGKKAADPVLTRRQSLDAAPVKNPLVKQLRHNNGDVELHIPQSLKPAMARLAGLFGKSPRLPTRKLRLDAMGSFVWDLMDGERTVKGIVRRFARRFDVLEREAEVAVTEFLRMLGRRGAIGMKVKP